MKCFQSLSLKETFCSLSQYMFACCPLDYKRNKNLTRTSKVRQFFRVNSTTILRGSFRMKFNTSKISVNSQNRGMLLDFIISHFVNKEVLAVLPYAAVINVVTAFVLFVTSIYNLAVNTSLTSRIVNITGLVTAASACLVNLYTALIDSKFLKTVEWGVDSITDLVTRIYSFVDIWVRKLIRIIFRRNGEPIPKEFEANLVEDDLAKVGITSSSILSPEDLACAASEPNKQNAYNPPTAHNCEQCLNLVVDVNVDKEMLALAQTVVYYDDCMKVDNESFTDCDEVVQYIIDTRFLKGMDVLDSCRLRKFIYSCYITKDVITTNAAPGMTIDRAMKYGISAIAFTTVCLTTCYSDKATSNVLTKLRTLSAMREELKQFKDLMGDFVADAFGVYIDDSDRCIMQLRADYDKLVMANIAKPMDYANDVRLLIETSQFVRTVDERIQSIQRTRGRESTGSVALIQSVTSELTALKKSLVDAQALLRTTNIREETLATFIFGVEAAGKTHFVLNKLLPAIANELKDRADTYKISFQGNMNTYWPEYLGQKHGVYDEFFSRGEMEPMLNLFNNIHSTGHANLEGAFIKDQPCDLSQIVYISNVPYIDLANVLVSGACRAFYSRFHAYELVNTRWDRNKSRENQIRIDYDDPTTYEIRAYLKPFTSPYTVENIPLDQSLKAQHLTDTGYDPKWIIESNGTTPPFCLLTVTQLVQQLSRRIQANRKSLAENKQVQLDSLIDVFLSQVLVSPNLTQTVIEQNVTKIFGYANSKATILDYFRRHGAIDANNQFTIQEIEINKVRYCVPDAILQYLGIVRINADFETQHYVVSLTGPSGCGKTVFARKLACRIKKLTHQPIREFCNVSAAVAATVKQRSIIVLHDAVTTSGESEYMAFYDSLPTECFIINTSNLRFALKRITPEPLPTETWTSYLASWITRFKPPRAWTIENTNLLKNPQVGFIRRLGIGYNLYHASEFAQRTDGTFTMLKAYPGYAIKTVTADGAEATFDSVSDFDKIMREYSLMRANSSIGTLHFINDPKDLPALAEVDVDVNTTTFEELKRNVTNFEAIVRTLATPTWMKITQRVMESQFYIRPQHFNLELSDNLEQLYQKILQFYGTLRGANPSLTVRVRCAEFEIIGQNNVLTVLNKSNLRCNKIYNLFVVEPSKPVRVGLFLNKHVLGQDPCVSLVSTRQQKVNDVLTTVTEHEGSLSYEEFAKCYVSGFDWAVLRATMSPEAIENMAALSSEVSTHPLIQPLIKRLSYTKSVNDVLNSKRARFLVFIQKFLGHALWKFVAGFCMLFGSAVAISTVGKLMFGSMKKPEVRTFKVRQLNGHKYTVSVDIVDGTIVRISTPIREASLIAALEDELEFSAPDLVIDDNVVISVNSDKAQDETRHKTLRKYHKSTAQIRGISVNADTSLGDPCVYNVIDKINANIFSVFNPKTTARVSGVAWFGNYVLTSAHVVYGDSVEDMRSERLLVTSYRTNELYPAKCVYIARYLDLAVLQLPDYPQQFPDLTRYFQNAIDETKGGVAHLTTARRIVHGGEKMQLYSTVGVLEALPCGRKMTGDNPNFHYADNVVNVARFATARGLMVSKGDCGLPMVVIRNNTVAISGLHFGDHGQSFFASRLNKEMMEGLKQQLVPDSIVVNASTRDDPLLKPIAVKVVDGTEQIMMVTPFTADALVNLVEPKDVYPIEGKHIHVLGYSDVGRHSHHLTARYEPTLFSQQVEPYIPNEFRNVATISGGVVDPSELIQSEQGKPSILFTQVNKFNQDVGFQNSSYPRLLTKARKLLTPLYKSWYASHDSNLPHKILTLRETINGFIFEDDLNYGLFERLNTDAAVGLDIQRQFKYGNIHAYLEVDKDDVAYNTDQPVLKFKDDAAGRYITKSYTEMMSYWRDGIRAGGLVQDNLKVELRLNDKVDKGNTRVFESFPLYVLLAMRALTGSIHAALKRNRDVGFCQLGLDRSDYTQLYNRFTEIGTYGEHGDFSNYDKSLTRDEIFCFRDVLVDILNSHKDDITWYKPLTMAITEICDCISIADGYVYVKNRGNTSGSSMTTILNCFVNDLRRYAVIIYLLEEHNRLVTKLRDPNKIRAHYVKQYNDVKDRKIRNLLMASIECDQSVRLQNVTLASIRAMTDHVCFGDDIASVISKNYYWLLNFQNFQRVYAAMGIRYDSPHKDGRVDVLTPINELMLLSRTFKRRRGIIYAELKISSINRMFHWITSPDTAQMQSNFDDIFYELLMYPKPVYDKYVAIVQDVVNPILYNYDCTIKIPDYAMGLAKYQQEVKDSLCKWAAPKRHFVYKEQKQKSLEFLTASLHSPKVETLNGLGTLESIISVNNTFDSNMTTLDEVNAMVVAIANDLASHIDTQYHSPIVKLSGKPAWNHTISRWSLSFDCSDGYNFWCDSVAFFQRASSAVCPTLSCSAPERLVIWTPEKHYRLQVRLKSPVPVTDNMVRLSTNTANVRTVSQEQFDQLQQLLASMRVNADTGKTIAKQGMVATTLLNVNEKAPVSYLQRAAVPVHSRSAYYQSSIMRKAFEWQWLRTASSAIGSIKGTRIINMNASACLNDAMKQLLVNNTYILDMEIDIRVVSTVVQGFSGSVCIGTTWSTTESDSIDENIMNDNDRAYIDLQQKSEHFFTLKLSHPQQFMSAVLVSDINSYFPYFVGMVNEKWQSTFDNKTITADLQIYTKFRKARLAAVGLPPAITGAVTPPPDSSLRNKALSSIIGRDMRVSLDGGISLPDTYTGRNLPRLDAMNFTLQFCCAENDEGLLTNWNREGKVQPPEGFPKQVQREITMLLNGWTYKSISTEDDIRLLQETPIRDGNGALTDPQLVDDKIVFFTHRIEPEKRLTNKLDVTASFRCYSNEQAKGIASFDEKSTAPLVMYEHYTSPLITALERDVTIEYDPTTDEIVSIGINLSTFPCKFNLLGTQWITDGGGAGRDRRYHLINMDLTARIGTALGAQPIVAYAMDYSGVPYTVLPENCARVILTDVNTKVPSVPPAVASAYSPTYFTEHELFTSLYPFLGDRTVTIQLVDRQYRQPICNLIYFGENKTVFVKVTSPNLYYMCIHNASDLVIANVNELGPGIVFPATQLGNSWLSRTESTFAETTKATGLKTLSAQNINLLRRIGNQQC
ncbi:MAG: polymerase protein [Apis picorna-like virus 6]|nr:MAG: polymerase protein [Apis picorna-like virus 6]